MRSRLSSRALQLLQDRVAEVAVGPSALRNQGSPGVVTEARRFLKSIKLSRFSTKSESGFQRSLDAATEVLKRRLPERARHWGTARKAINLFLRDCLYHSYLSLENRLGRLEPWLEIPLDSQVAAGVLGNGQTSLPRWPGIKHLTPEVSQLYQQAARQIASERGVHRVHLDLEWWRPGRGP